MAILSAKWSFERSLITKVLKTHFYFLFLSLFLSSCNLSSPIMTAQAFDCISIGTPVEVVEKQAGKPYRITSKKEMKQYYYIERIQTNPYANAQNTYILTVKEGVVVDKQCSNESKSLNIQVH